MAPAEPYDPRRRRHYDQDESDHDRRQRGDSRGERRKAPGGGSRDRRRSPRDRRRSRTPDPSHRRRHGERDRGSRDRDGRGRDGRDRSSRRHDKPRGSREEGPADGRRRRPDKDDGSGDDAMREHRGMVKHRGPLPSQQDSFSAESGDKGGEQKDKPNWANTGLLAAASNSVTQSDGTSVTLKYHEPAEARKPPPRDQWKLFVFKGGDIVDTVDLNLRSCWLVGRDGGVANVLAEHPSISKQHAVIQFRYTDKTNEFGDRLGRVKPYLLDLESANGTTLNGARVPESRYLEMRDKDMIQFGHSTREYVVMLAPRD